jgi:hypothetical protein
MTEIRAFKNAKKALDSGFADGAEDRKNGFPSEGYARSLREEGEQWKRGQGSPFYEEWCCGYTAGFRGLKNPGQA